LALSYKQLALEDDVSAFDCGSDEWQLEVANFLKEDALAQQDLGLNRTFLFFDEDSRLIGYTSLAASSLRLEADPSRLQELPGISEAVDGGRRAFPAVLIGQFAVAAGEQKKGYGQIIAEWVRAHALNLQVGARSLTLHVDTRNRQARNFWSSAGFVNSQDSGSAMMFLWCDLLLGDEREAVL